MRSLATSIEICNDLIELYSNVNCLHDLAAAHPEGTGSVRSVQHNKTATVTASPRRRAIAAALRLLVVGPLRTRTGPHAHADLYIYIYILFF